MSKRNSMISFPLLMSAVFSLALMMGTAALGAQQPEPNQQVVCADCHSCKTPTTGNPCLLVACPRPRTAKDVEAVGAELEDRGIGGARRRLSERQDPSHQEAPCHEGTPNHFQSHWFIRV